MRRWGGALLVLAAATACQERLTSPANCPEQCPGGSADVFDLVLNPLPGSDSSFYPYVAVGAGNSLLVSDGLPAAEARAVYRFTSRPDSLFVRDTARAYTIDSVSLSFTLSARDTLLDGLRLLLYRAPASVDSGVTFSDLTSFLVDSNLVDTLPVPDTLNAGRVQTVLRGEELDRVVLPPEDGGVLALGVAISAPQPTGVRLGSAAGGTGAAFTTFVTLDVPDTATAVRQQQILRSALFNTYAVATPLEPDPDLLTVGGAPSSRALLRFDLPENIEDSATIVRATLELIPRAPILGLRTDPAVLTARAVLADLGAKSPVSEEPTFVVADTLTPGIADTVRLEVTRLVQLWQSSAERPEAIFLSLFPEAASFMRPEFGSTRTPEIGAPRLRVTYQLPFPFENP